MLGHVYQIKNLVNDKVYIGQTSRSVEQRWHEHIKRLGGHNRHLCHSMQKHGIENFDFSVLYTVRSNDKHELLRILNEAEISLIRDANSTDENWGYNIMLGGNNQTIPSSVRKQISESVKKYQIENPQNLDKFRFSMVGRKHKPESIVQMSKSRSGERNPNFGKPSPFRGKKRDPEMGKKVSQTKKLLGQGIPQKCKIAQLKAIRKPVCSYSLDGNFVKRYDFIGGVSEDGFSGLQVSRRTRDQKNKIHRNHIWLYEHDDINAWIKNT